MRSNGVSRKCASMLAAPARSAAKASQPQRITMASPAADHSEYLPPTQSHIGNTSVPAMPNARAASTLAVTAMKCCANAPPPPRLPVSHWRADCAFLSVSTVVNVLEVTMNSVVAGSRPARAPVRCSGSTLDTKATSMPSRGEAHAPASASHTIAGPRSEPPIPRWTTLRIGRPVAPSLKPPRSCAASARIRASVARIAGMMSAPSTSSGASPGCRSAV